MAHPLKFIPIEDIKGLKTLFNEGKTQHEIVSYYSEKGIKVDQATISRRLKEIKGSDN